MLSPDLHAAYRATRIEVDLPSGSVVIPAADEAPLASLPSELGDGAWILTAWNPRSRVLAEVENASRSRALAAELRAFEVAAWSAVGRARDGDWAETSWLVVGLTRTDALALGARFGQNAIFWLDQHGLDVVPVPEIAGP